MILKHIDILVYTTHTCITNNTHIVHTIRIEYYRFYNIQLNNNYCEVVECVHQSSKIQIEYEPPRLESTPKYC